MKHAAWAWNDTIIFDSMLQCLRFNASSKKLANCSPALYACSSIWRKVYHSTANFYLRFWETCQLIYAAKSYNWINWNRREILYSKFISRGFPDFFGSSYGHLYCSCYTKSNTDSKHQPNKIVDKDLKIDITEFLFLTADQSPQGTLQKKKNRWKRDKKTFETRHCSKFPLCAESMFSSKPRFAKPNSATRTIQ